MMSGRTQISEFMRRLGFEADPFELTNSDSEPLLDQYFVPPPFFSSVLGDPSAPRPTVVFAPRGTGKTAQRISVEYQSRENQDFLCVTYDDFGINSKAALEQVDLDHHSRQICIRLSLALLALLSEKPDRTKHLSAHQRQVLLHCARTFLGDLTQHEYSTALASVKTLKDKGADAWAKYGGAVASILASLLQKIGLAGVKIPADVQESFGRGDNLKYLIDQLVAISRVLGFRSTYVLVDRVDELQQTSQDARASWDLVKDMLTNLPFLEMPGVGLKFFLWDQIRGYFLEEGGRPDRVSNYQLKWTPDDLRNMLGRRLAAYSNGKVQSISALFDPRIGLDVETMVVYLAAGSPRDMVRLCKAIADEGTRIAPPDRGISRQGLLGGIRSFSREYADVVAGNRVAELRRIGGVTFTINQLASDVFNISVEAARSRVQKWQTSGLVHKVDERPNKINRPVHVYSIRDPRVAIACSEGLDVDLVLDNFLMLCRNCISLQVAGEAQFRCSECDQVQTIQEAMSVWAASTVVS